MADSYCCSRPKAEVFTILKLVVIQASNFLIVQLDDLLNFIVILTILLVV